jgi:hypothetical protein
MRMNSVKRRTIGATVLLAVAAAGAGFGATAALEGDTAVVGAYGANSLHGAAYVFTRTGTNWTQQAELTAADGAQNESFGASVAVSGDTAVAGAWQKNSAQGAAYVFTRTGTTWTQQAKLTPGDAADNVGFGYSVAISGDTAVVGSLHQNRAYVFTRTGTAWTQQQKLAASDMASGDLFGNAVAVQGDTAVIGANGKDSSQGAAYVFTRTGTAWTQQQKLTAGDGVAEDDFGVSVALAGDTVAVGADGKTNNRGAAYVFTRTGTTWTQQQRLTPADAADDDTFGFSAAISGDTAVVGAFGKNSSQGVAYVFKRAGTTWTRREKLTAADGAGGDDFGSAVAVSGGTAVVGAFAKDSTQGAAYVFTSVGRLSGYCLPSKVKVKHTASKGTLVASGTLDTGPGAPDFSGAAYFEFVSPFFRLDVPQFVAKGRKLTYSVGGAGGGAVLTIVPSKSGSSRARFAVTLTDLTGHLVSEGPAAFRFVNSANVLEGVTNLRAGAPVPHGINLPEFWIVRAAATIKGGGRDELKLKLGFTTDGTMPAKAEDLTVGFGDTYTAALVGGWVKHGTTSVHTAKAPGITSAIVDYAKGTITIAGSRLDLGAFAKGGNPVTVTVTRGADTRTASIRMALAGTKLSY